MKITVQPQGERLTAKQIAILANLIEQCDNSQQLLESMVNVNVDLPKFDELEPFLTDILVQYLTGEEYIAI